MRVTIWVKPGARRSAVGGERDGALVVAVTARAVEGKATEAARRAVADALGLPDRLVHVTSGATSRTKVLDVDADVADEVQRLRLG